MIEVITPATNLKLTTVAAVKADLGITGSDQDAQLGTLIDQYSAAIVGWCDRPFALETVRETLFERCRSDGLMLSRWPIVSITSVAIDGTTLNPADYVADKVTGILYRRSATAHGAYWPAGESVVEFSAGYILPGDDDRTLPHDVERAAIMLVKGALAYSRADLAVRSIEVQDIETVNFWNLNQGGDMPLHIQGLLSGYRRLAIG